MVLKAIALEAILRIKSSPNDHPAEVPETMLTAHDEERLIKVGMVLPQLFLLDLPTQPQVGRRSTEV